MKYSDLVHFEPIESVIQLEQANSLAAAERMELLEKLVEAGVDPARMMPGKGSHAVLSRQPGGRLVGL